MLEFVHVSGADGGKDLQTRRKVRSQAMRDFRRRQRAEREAASKGKKRLSVPGERAGSPAWEARQRATSTGSDSTDYSRRTSERGPSPRSTPLLIEQKEGESAFQTLPSHKQHDLPYDMAALNAMDEWQYPVEQTSHSVPESLYWPSTSSRGQSPSIPQDASIWAPEPLDPFESPAQISQMLGFCRSYIHWLRPGVQTETAGKLISEEWDKSQCPMLLAACCLASVGHLDAVQPNRPVGNYDLYKNRVLRDISTRMKNPDQATSDDTIGALTCLLSFEMSKGNAEASTHLNGLKGLVKMKGGSNKLRLNGVPLMLDTLDLLHAVLFDSQPVLSDARVRGSNMRTEDHELSAPDALSKLLPLLTAEYEIFQEDGPTPLTENLRHLPEIFDYALACLRTVSHFASGESVNRFRTALEAFRNQSCREHTETPDAYHLGRSCSLMLSILFNLLVHRIPYRHSSNQVYVDELFNAIRSVQNRSWESIPYLRLFILLTAAVTTNDQSLKSFFKAELVRSIYQLGMEEWKRVEAFILRFLELKRVLEKDDRLSTPPIAMSSPRRATEPTYFSMHRWPEPNLSHVRSSVGHAADRRGAANAQHVSFAPSPLMFATSAPGHVALQTDGLFDDRDLDPILRYNAGIDDVAFQS